MVPELVSIIEISGMWIRGYLFNQFTLDNVTSLHEIQSVFFLISSVFHL